MRVRGVKDSTVSLRSSTIGYGLSRIAANIATLSVRISTISLRLRYELGHAHLPPQFATIRHECFKQFKTSVALPWRFPNYHDSSRFTAIHHGSTTNHHGTPRYTTILQIVANRSGTVAKNRECVNGALKLIQVSTENLNLIGDSWRYIQLSFSPSKLLRKSQIILELITKTCQCNIQKFFKL